MKVINTKGIIILAVILLVIQLAVGFIISPFVGAIVVDKINEYSDAKISVGAVHVWPLTLSCTLKDVKVFDPDNSEKRMVLVKKASLRISPLALLAKRLALADLVVKGAVIDLKGEADGSFNIQKLAEPKGEASKKSIFDRFKGKQDWFSRVYDMIKESSSKEASEKKIKEEAEARKPKREVIDLPHGRLVEFNTKNDQYAFMIRSFVVKDSRINIEADTGEKISVEKANFVLKNLGIRPDGGAEFNQLKVSGELTKDKKSAGTFNFDYSQSVGRDKQKTSCSASAKNVDLPAVSFFYESSLPVEFKTGLISINSKTEILNGDLNSSNSIVLRDHEAVAQGKSTVMGIVPLSTLCEALNQVDPAKFKFVITGTVDKPVISGFDEALMELVKPYLNNLAEKATEDLAQKGADYLKNLLEKKE